MKSTTFLFLTLLCLLTLRAPGQLTITEVMPDNARILADEDGQFPDWIEIHNPGPAGIDLLGWHLTDDPAALAKWTFPSVTLPAGGYLVVFASGKDRTINPARLHTSFQLEANGEFLALVAPDGVTVVSAFSPAFPPVKEDISYGRSQRVVTSSLLSNSVPRILVPTGAGDLPPDWNAPAFVPGGNWLTGIAPPALGFDTNQPAPAPSNLAPGGAALQSTTFGSQQANLAINNLVTDFTQTLNTDTDPFWQVTLASDALIHRVVLRNRTSCCGSRLRDIQVEILSAGGGATNFTSALLNPENTGFTYPAGPAALTNDLLALTGGPVAGRIVRVRRTPDPDLSGSGGQGGADEAAVLALGEVEVVGVALGGAIAEVNLARTGSPAPTATQSSVNGSFTASLAINGNLGDFTHTLGTDANPTWTLNLGRRAVINSITLHNRDSCCGSRLRDITVEVLDQASNVIFTSPLLNPENAGNTFPNGPDNIVVTLSPSPVLGQYVRVRRTPDPDLSGTGGQGNADEAAVLSLGEVIVLGYDLNGYRPFIRTDLQSPMLGQNASAFVRLPFNVANPSALTSFSLRLRYDDGALIYLNGVEVASRNAPVGPAWNSAATASRDLAAGILSETIDLAFAIGTLVPGANVLAVHALNVSASDGDFLLQPELLATELQVTTNVFLTSATPGAQNDTDFYYDEVADTRLSVDRGFFTNAFLLEITSATPGAQIYYSFNGDEPGPGKGLLYTGPITITNTTVLRTRAFRDGWKPTDVDTATYLFLGDVIYQARDWPQTRVPPPYFPATWGANAVDYGMDPEIVTNYTLAQWYEALTQIPSMSVVTEMRHLFDAATGIYANASGHGEVWERPASLELLDPHKPTPSQFQENCGLRIRGGFSRNSDFRKHSLRVFFRREYGTGRLRYPLFEDEGAQEFDTFDLRTSQNYSWPRGSESPTFETMVREVWCRKTLGDMGQPYRRSRYYHLYLNGQYWGLYETDERPEASYGETYFGGSKTNFDVVKCGNRGVTPTFATEATDGNLFAWSNLWVMCQMMRTNASNTNYFRPLGLNPDGTRNTNYPVMIDVDNLIDYMLEIFFSGDGDATLSAFLSNNQANNWFGMRDRTNPDVGFRFFNSDCEHTIGSPSSRDDRTGPFGGSNEGIFMWSNPQWMHEELMRNFEYRVRFGDHVQKHFFNGGALTLEACTNRFIAKAVQINKAIRAYSARWGDANSAIAYGETHWTNAIAFCLNWFTNRGNIVLAQLRADNLFPAVGAPAFSSYGGFVSPGAVLTMTQTNPAGTIYFTTNGADPRLVGGAVSGDTQVYAAPVSIEGNTHVRARVRVGTNWSALVEASFTTAQYFRDLVLTEIMYAPPGTPTVDGADFEFLELKNTGSTTLNLSGLSFTSGISFTFPSGTRLAPGAIFLLARNKAAFESRYPGVTVNGVFSGRLDNAGETLRLAHFIGGQVFAVTYADEAPWPLAPDGHGFSVVPVSLSANRNSDDGRHWRASAASGGSPGADDPAPNIPPVVVNEVLTHGAAGQDFIELHNPTAGSVNVGGWFLTDDASVPRKFRIPAGTSIDAGGYAVFTEARFNPTPGLGTSFRFNAAGDDVYLFSGDANTNLTGYSQGFDFGAAPEDVTFGRHVSSTGEEQFPLQVSPTPGAANSGPRIGPVVLSEIHYNPRYGDAFIELKNISGGAVDLFDPLSPTNTWRVNGLDFNFPTGVSLPAGGLALVVETDPTLFRTKHNVPAAVPVFGPYAGALQDSGERLELQRPDPRTNGFAYVTVDEVRYNDRAPWPTAADGSGPSLQKPDPALYGNEPLNWRAAVPTPGNAWTGGNAPSITQQPANVSVVASREAMFTVGAGGPAPLFYQWRLNGTPLPDATNSFLMLTNLQLSQAGSYSAVVFNAAGAAESEPATLTVLVPARILEPPRNVMVRVTPDPQAAPTTNVTFSVLASSTSPISYQWTFKGAPIPGATNSTHTITNVQVADGGPYAVAVTDAVGTIFSPTATLSPLVTPVITQPPLSQSVVDGGEFTFSVGLSGSPAPFRYQWRRVSTPIGTFLSDDQINFLTLSATAGGFILASNMPSSNFTCRIVISNAASAQVFHTFTLTVLADADRDGIPDEWETAAGLSPTDAADAALDRDTDGLSNLAEYRAGTDPTNELSYLKVALTAQPGLATVLFGAVSNKTYTVLFTDALGSGSWLKLADVLARPDNRVEMIPDAAWTSNRVYRVATPRQP